MKQWVQQWVTTFHDTIERAVEEQLQRLSPYEADDRAVVQRAVQHVRRGAIRWEVGDEPATIRYTVEPSEQQVTLRSNEPSTWNEREHLSGWLSLYSMSHSVNELIESWREGAFQPSERPATNERTPEAWNRFFNHSIDQFLLLVDGATTHVFVNEWKQVYRRFDEQKPFEWEWQPLYELFGTLSLLEASLPVIGQVIDSHDYELPYEKWQAEQLLDEATHRIRRAVHQLKEQPRLFETDAFFKALPPLIRRATLSTTDLFSFRFHTYRLLWEELFKEREQLEEMEQLYEVTASDALFFNAALHILHGKDFSLAPLFARSDEEAVERAITFANYVETEDRIDLLHELTTFIVERSDEWIRPDLPFTTREERLQEVYDFIVRADFSEEACETWLRSFGDVAESLYAQFLIDRDRCGDWTQLVLQSDTMASLFTNDVREVVARRAPEAVVPIYHQFVLRAIDGKTRDDYRQAVRLLKEMKRPALQAFASDWWNGYIEAIQQSFSRLRALREELEKGQLTV